MKVYLNRNFLLTYIASFISLFGSKLLMMAYIAYIFAAKGSAALASIVFAAEWATCLVIGLFGTRYIDRANAKHLLIGLNAIAALVTLLFVNFIRPEYYYYAISVIIARALLSHSINSSRIKALIQFFSREETEIFSPIFNSSMFIATALAGAVGFYILNFINLTTVVYIDSISFLLAAIILLFVKPNRERLAESIAAPRKDAAGGLYYLQTTFSIIANNKNLASAVFYIILSVTSLQATYEILMTVIPQVWFHLGKPGTALFFAVESLFVTLASFLYQYIYRRGLITDANQRLLNLIVLAVTAATYLLLSQLKTNLYLCLIFFNVMVIGVELIWTHQFKQMISNSPPANVAAVTGVQMAMGYSLMGVFAFAFSTGLDRWGIDAAIYMNILFLALLVGGWESLMKLRSIETPAAVTAD